MSRKDWVETEATVDEVYVDGGGRSRQVSVVFAYTVDGHYYSGTYTPFAEMPAKGTRMTIRYDPNDPEKNDLVAKESKLRWIKWILAAIGFIAMILRFA